MNHGVEISITKMVKKTWKKHRKSALNDSGICFSMFSTSLLKRLMMRPDGVVSKNSIVDFSMDSNILKCIDLDAFKNMDTKK